MNVLVACEFSGRVREAFRALGHNAWSCDLLPTEDNSPYHIQSDVKNLLTDACVWDLMVAHPPCTHLAVSGACWWKNKKQEQAAAIEFFMILINANIPKIAVENPVGIISSAYRKPDQYIQPYWFGEPFQKKTGLWLKNLPLLVPTNMVDKGETYKTKDGKSRGGSWHMKLPESSDRWKIRSRTFQGMATAMALQWGR